MSEPVQILQVGLIPTSVPLPLQIVGTDQFDFRAPFRNELDGLHAQVGNVTIDHNTLYRWAIDEFGALVQSVDQMKLETANAVSMIQTEKLQRVDQNLALAQQIDTLFVSYDDASAKIQQEQLVRADADSALTFRLDQQIARIDGAYAEISEERTTRVSMDEALAEQITIFEAVLNDNTAQILEERTARVTEDEALALAIDELRANMGGDAESLVQVEREARAAADNALASQITTVQSNLDGNVATVNERITTEINTVTGKIEAIWEADVTVNGLIGGFKLVNDGMSVAAGFDVDQFSIGRTNADKVAPFRVIGGVTYMDDALIEKLTFTKLRDATGNFLVENGKLKAQYVEAQQAVIGVAQIDTLMLKGNAVTIPLTQVVSAPTGRLPFVADWRNPTIPREWANIQELWIDFGAIPPQAVMVQTFVNFLATGGGSNGGCVLRIVEDNVNPSMETGVSVMGGFSTSIPFAYTFQPGHGLHKYTVQARIDGTTPYVAGPRSMVILGSRK